MKVLEAFKKEKDKRIKTHKRVFSRVIAKQYLRDIKKTQSTTSKATGSSEISSITDFPQNSCLNYISKHQPSPHKTPN